MSHNGYGANGGRSVLVLYRIINSESDAADPFYNCFSMPFGSGPTLNTIKQHCAAVHSLSHLGPEGFHWRVMVEDKPGAEQRSFSWWDIQDGNAKLPVKETSQYDLRKLLFPSKAATNTADSATKAAKGAFKLMGKAMASAIGDDAGVEEQGPPVSVLVVKLLDIVKIHDEYNLKHGGHAAPPPPRPRRSPAPTPARRPAPPHQQQSRPPTAAQSRPQQQRAQTAPSGNLMDFGDAPAVAPPSGGGGFNPKSLRHSSSSPATVNPNETRAQRLKREHEEKMKKSNRVWDDIDQRWVEVDPKIANGGSVAGGGGLANGFGASASAPPKKKEVGIKLDMSSAVGKSSSVQQAVHQRISKMEASQKEAVANLARQTAIQKEREEEEDRVRKQLEPKIKAWSEEHGKKKQLQALLGSLHTILWPGAKWKQISIGDVLDASKCKKAYFKATLVVHPDKTDSLPADQRFLAKRIFDALTQAKTIWDEENAGR